MTGGWEEVEESVHPAVCHSFPHHPDEGKIHYLSNMREGWVDHSTCPFDKGQVLKHLTSLPYNNAEYYNQQKMGISWPFKGIS